MSMTVSVVESSRPDQLVDAAAELGGKISALDVVLATQRRAVAHLREFWRGQAADATGWRVADDGTVTAPPVPAVLAVLAPAWTAILRKLLALFAGIDAETAAAVTAVMEGPVPESPPGTLGDPRRPPPPDAPAEDVKQWWDSLSEEERRRLIADHPPELGNLNGIPAEVRHQVNEAVLRDDLDRVRDAAEHHGVTPDEVLADPGAYGLTAADATRYRNAVQTQKGLDAMGGTDTGETRPVMLWAYDPLAFNGQGRAAVAIGNPDEAENTAVVVPGTGSSVAQGWLEGDNATNLYDQMRLGEPDKPASVIAWMGYDAPDSPLDPRIATPWLARDGGELLAADVNGLGVTHEGGDRTVTVIGHSYGSTTVADAFAGSGMQADNAVLIGSPGTDLARSAADFNLPEGGQVYVGAASSDPVTWLGQGGAVPDILNHVLDHPLGSRAGLGTDPAGDGYGSVRFDAEVPGRSGPSFGHHSAYYDVGSESLRAMTDIANGNGATLAENGYTAEGRRQVHIGLPDTVNLPFIGEVDLPDWDTRIPGTPAVNDPEGDRDHVTQNHQY